jgi:hypothetical protein
VGLEVLVEWALESGKALESAKALDLEWVSASVLVLEQEELAQGCQGNQRCYCKPCWDRCCRDHLFHLEDKCHMNSHHPTCSNNMMGLPLLK